MKTTNATSGTGAPFSIHLPIDQALPAGSEGTVDDVKLKRSSPLGAAPCSPLWVSGFECWLERGGKGEYEDWLHDFRSRGQDALDVTKEDFMSGLLQLNAESDPCPKPEIPSIQA